MEKGFSMLKYKTAAALLFFSCGSVQASSEEAWEAFARTVEEKCLAAAADTIEAPTAVVDPYGSESFGLAVVTGKAKGADATISRICVMNKQSETVELGSELSGDPLAVKNGE